MECSHSQARYAVAHSCISKNQTSKNGKNNERKTIPKAGDPSPRPNMDFMNKADALLKNNLDQLNARIAKKIQNK